MSKRIAFIGSSGGNLYKQGGNDLPAMMKEICGQTTAADMEITFVQYVLASGSLDNVGPDSPATLYTWNGTEVQAVFQGTLTEVNVEAAKVDAELAKQIDDGEIDGVMFVSASPDGANRQAMEACARTKIPMAGTGGSGVALTQNMGCNVLSASGTTGTTNRTRAVAFTTALAKYWKIKYMPVIGNTGENAASKADAVTLSKSVVTSTLTKAAIFGHDANWGRILCAMGYSGVQFDPEKVDIYFESKAGKIKIVEDGTATDYSEEEATKILSEKEVTALLDVKMGDKTATAWGCDLTYDYVKINADYRS